MADRTARALSRIVDIRGLQRQAKQMRLMQASAALQAQIDLQTREQAEQASREASWFAVAERRSLDLGLMRGWSRAVLDGALVLKDIDGAVADAEQDQVQAGEDWRAAQAQFDGAEALARKAWRQCRRAREDRLLAEAADRFNRRGPNAD